MKRAKISHVILASVALALTCPAYSAEKEKGERSERSKEEVKLSAAEKMFLEMVALSDMAEIKLAKAAQEKATDDQLKQHAAKMIEDHTKVSTDLKQLAKQKDVDLKEELPAPKRAMIEEITSKSGADFDKAYLEHEIAGHRMAVVLFQNCAEFAKDPEIQQFAQKYQPVIEEHRKMLEQLGQKTTQAQPSERGGETAGTRATTPAPQGGQPGSAGQQQQSQQPQQPAGQVRTE